jgi:uncharacterized protein (DUF1697 family)
MTTHVALLRGINVGKAKRVAMADLRDLLADLGYADPRSLLISGNLVYTTRVTPASAENAISRAIKEQLGMDVDVLVRTTAQLEAVVAANPFVARGDAPEHLYATFLSTKPAGARLKAVDAEAVLPDEFAGGDRVIYSVQPNGTMGSKLPSWEKALDVRASARTWRTVLKLQALAAG